MKYCKELETILDKTPLESYNKLEGFKTTILLEEYVSKKTTDSEFEDLLGTKQMENFVIERMGGSCIATPIEEMDEEEREEAVKNEEIDIQHPTYKELDKSE